jgi:hypothetical protein
MPLAVNDAVLGLTGVFVGGVLGFIGTAVGGFLLKRQELRQQARLDVLREHLPALQSIPRDDPETTIHVNAMVTACTVIGETEQALAIQLDRAYGVAAAKEKSYRVHGSEAGDLEWIAATGQVSELVIQLRERLSEDLRRGLRVRSLWRGG